jgi:outer membrane protein
MMKLFSFAILIVILLNINLSGQEKKSFTLDDCLKIGMENSKSLKIAQQKIYSAESKIKEVNTAFYPSVKFLSSYTRLSSVDPFTMTLPPPINTSFDISPSILDNYGAKLSLTQSIFTGGRISSNSEMMEQNISAAKADYNKEKNQLIYDIKNAFWNYYKAIEFQKTVEKTVTQVEAHLKDVENLMNRGMATNNDVLRVKVQLSNTKLLLLDAKNNVGISMIGLNNAIGIPLNDEIIINAPVELKPNKTFSLDSLIRTAINNRPEIKAMEYRIKMNESSITMTKSSWFPQISAAANYYYSKPNSRIFPSVNEFRGTWDIGIVLSYDLWNWRLTSHQTDQAVSSFEQSKLLLGQIKDGIMLEVNQVYLGLVKAQEKIPVADETVKQADENLRITTQKYNQGLALNSDVIDAETSQLQASINYTSVIVDFELMMARLEKAINK